jgi:hypothetical protein
MQRLNTLKSINFPLGEELHSEPSGIFFYAMEKKSFVIHKDSLCILDRLTDEQAGKLFKAIRNVQNGIEPTDDTLIQIVLEPFVQQFKRDEGKWQATIERNAKNGAKGGRPRQSTDNQSEKEETQEKPKNPVGYFGLLKNPNKPKKADSDSVSVSDSDSDSVSVNDSECIVEQSSPPKKSTRTIFVKPAQDDIFAYMIEYTQSKNQTYAKQFLQLESSKMFNYYESKGWTIGKSPMKDWKATTRNWLLNQNAKNNPQTSCAERPATKRTIYT